MPALGGITLTPNLLVLSWGVLLDPALLVFVQRAAEAKSAFIQLRWVRQLRPFLARRDLVSVTHLFIYCSYILS